MHSPEQYLKALREEYRRANKKEKSRAAQRSAKADAIESQGVDPETGACAETESPALSTGRQLWRRGGNRASSFMGVVRLPVLAAVGCSAAQGSAATASGGRVEVQR